MNVRNGGWHGYWNGSYFTFVPLYSSWLLTVTHHLPSLCFSVPVSAPVLDVTCLQNDSAVISCRLENGTYTSLYLTVSAETTLYNTTSSSRTVRVTVPPVSLSHFWNINCTATNNISERSIIQTHAACPGKRFVCPVPAESSVLR